VSWTEWSEDHIARYAVRPQEVEDVLYGRPRYVTAGREQTTLVFGTTTAGRRLLVVVANAPDGGITVVTARDLTASEARMFDRKGR
jgi:hypothetical protein